MKEARIILVHQLDQTARAAAELTIVTYFGGMTQTVGKGMWKDASGTIIHDDIFVCDVAMEDNAVNQATLINIAKRFAQQAGQDCVYVRHANGTVQLIDQNRDNIS